MKKVKEKKVNYETQDEIQFGTPTMVLLPARNYRFKVSKNEYKIVIPRSGKYVDIDPSFFNEADGYFRLYDDDNEVMYLPAISKVLFATKTYPNLDINQLFAPIAISFTDTEVTIIGQVVEMLQPESNT